MMNISFEIGLAGFGPLFTKSNTSGRAPAAMAAAGAAAAVTEAFRLYASGLGIRGAPVGFRSDP